MTAVIAEVDAHEGPVYAADEEALYFTSLPRPEVDIKRLDLRSGEDAHRIEALDVRDGRRLFAVIDPGYPDGIKIDAAGRVYSAGPAGVQVFAPEGEVVADIPVPGAVHLAFENSSPPTRIHVTADTAVWAAPTIEPEEA